jgi:hypothetical protein
MADEEQERTELIAVPLQWIGAEDVAILLANQFIIQFGPDGFTFLVGQASQPILLGSSTQELIEKARQISSIPVRTLGKFAIPAVRLPELIDILQRNLAKYEETIGPVKSNASTDLLQ